MIQIFEVTSASGAILPVKLEFPLNPFENVDHENYQLYFDSSLQGISWKNEENQRGIINDENVDVIGFPTIDLKYIVAIYKGINGAFLIPNNAVIYNLDGTIHKVLKITELISERSKKYLEKENLENPPLSLAKYPQGLAFSNFGWRKDINGNLINSISIDFDRDYGEKRELNPETGEIGKVLDDWQIKDRFFIKSNI
ncbi:hypothetical protein [Chryseobacterium indoltheticum]|uniref:Uncharacterized protein n=1 Tax=Chryseobacterium indoltheticum TaxID=254 RepID=A0A381F464_9FLAO|nr:hypothetical protein [Chryseobacterium indoltheticum]AZA74939.1 hypothetical protein EG358_14710 [Chryseobacterium indoltheticum]SIQ29656.1 hypothetical protein SAMN05421682_10415 [Chryseobacterium indoltheticum]SUX41389.1 Uncharacterised protein [Chryseobacterium indoltheticum]